MGEVYRAHDTRLKRDVAIKVLPKAFARDHSRLARFRREAQLLAQLSHPNIAAIHELGETDGVTYLVMEYVPGETLAELLRAGIGCQLSAVSSQLVNGQRGQPGQPVSSQPRVLSPLTKP